MNKRPASLALVVFVIAGCSAAHAPPGDAGPTDCSDAGFAGCCEPISEAALPCVRNSRVTSCDELRAAIAWCES